MRSAFPAASGRSAACRSATPGTTTVAPRRCAGAGAPWRRSCTVARGEGRAVLVTGASRGIGRVIARAFAGQGDRVAVHWGSSRERADAVLAELPGNGHVLVQADMADPDAVAAMVDESAAEL